ncbi:MAG: hypothetical protein LBS97_01825 [Treponema sp.]|jgi:hypothetical protein|nr:hypothetical protein [Treponema sp.]
MNNFEDQLDVIRAELYEETKNMTNADAARFVNETARPIAAKYGIKIIKEPNFALKKSYRMAING